MAAGSSSSQNTRPEAAKQCASVSPSPGMSVRRAGPSPVLFPSSRQLAISVGGSQERFLPGSCIPEDGIDVGALGDEAQAPGAKPNQHAMRLDGAREMDGLAAAEVGAAIAHLGEITVFHSSCPWSLGLPLRRQALRSRQVISTLGRNTSSLRLCSQELQRRANFSGPGVSSGRSIAPALSPRLPLLSAACANRNRLRGTGMRRGAFRATVTMTPVSD